MKLNLVDTHAHIFMDHFSGDREEVISEAAGEGIGMINMGLDLPSSRRSVELAENHRGVYAGIGYHPHEAKDFGPSALKTLLDLGVSDSVVAVGEIGLDYYRDNSPRDQQREAFRAQLDLALELGLPVSVHNRSSTEDMLDILRGRTELPPGVMHSFFGDEELAGELLDLGFHLGLSGPLTFSGESDLRDTVSKLPLDRLVLETDSPFLTPEPHRGKRNEPGYVKYVGEELARVRGLEAEEVAEKTTENAGRLFGLDEY